MQATPADAAKALCEKLGWPFDTGKVVITKSKVDPAQIYLISSNVGVCLYGPSNTVRAASNHGYETSRRNLTGRLFAFATTDEAWFDCGTTTAKKIWPGLTLRGTKVEHFRPDDRKMMWSDSRTVRVSFQTTAPANVDNRVVLIFDRDHGKLISFSNFPKKNR